MCRREYSKQPPKDLPPSKKDWTIGRDSNGQPRLPGEHRTLPSNIHLPTHPSVSIGELACERSTERKCARVDIQVAYLTPSDLCIISSRISSQNISHVPKHESNLNVLYLHCSMEPETSWLYAPLPSSETRCPCHIPSPPTNLTLRVTVHHCLG